MGTKIRMWISVIVSVFGIIGLISGVVIYCLLPSIVRERVKNEVVLKPENEAAHAWTEPPVVASIQFWLFNVTNANEIVFQGAKPALVQIGPYGFREHLSKRRVSFSANNSVFFTTHKEYFYDQELSCKKCRLGDVFTVPNIPYLTVMKLIRNHSAAKGILDFLGGILLRLVGEHPFVSNVTASQLLFEGYNDQIFKLVNQFKPGLVPEKMGLFYKRNGTEDGPYEIKNGLEDIARLGEIITWQGQDDLSALRWWNPNYTQASMINGTDGGIYPPFLKKSDILPIFARDICRSTYVTYNSTIDIQGLPAYRFMPPADVFSSANKANRGFCWPSNEKYYTDKVQPKLDGGLCLPSGMLDVSRCYANAPIVMTSPQFVFCPDEVIESVDGLSEPSDEFITTIDLEPTTGVVISASKKLQLNVEMYADSSKPLVFQKMRPVIIPIVWLNESIAINDQTRNYIYKNIVTSQNVAYAGSYAAVGIGAILILLGLAAFVILKIQNRRNTIGDQDKFMPQHIDAAEPAIHAAS